MCQCLGQKKKALTSVVKQPQTELFYTGEKSRLLGTNLNDVNSPSITEDSVNAVGITMGANSTLAAYWPWTIYQSTDASLHRVRNRLYSTFSPSTTWDGNRIGISALPGSKLAIVPCSANFTRIALKGGYGVFYQTLDGRLSVAVTDSNSPEVDPLYSLSWPTGMFAGLGHNPSSC